jgi:DNA-binding transcriptional LysR family regulator
LLLDAFMPPRHLLDNPRIMDVPSTHMDKLKADLQAVRLFVQVVDSKTFRGAGEALGVPKSTVSLRVAQLEDQLGERLLERTTRRLRLTDAGAAYYRSAVAALEELRDAERTLSDRKSRPAGKLRVTTTIEGGQFVFAPLFAEYLRRYPEVELEVLLTDRRVDLIEEGVDLAIRGGDLPDSALVAHRLKLSGSLRCYASPRYLERRGTPRHPRELPRHDCLVMSGQREPSAWKFSVDGRASVVQVRPRAVANSFMVLGEFARVGLGVALMPSSVAAASVEDGSLQQVLTAFVPAPAALHAVYPSARHLSAKVRALLELLDEAGREQGTRRK